MMVEHYEKNLGSLEGCRKKTPIRTRPLLLRERSTEKEVNFLTSSEWPEILQVSWYAHSLTESKN